MAESIANIGYVAIGRNEGARLGACLRSLQAAGPRIVYVDSGSADDSLSQARSLGVETVVLKEDAPYTAARARNEGFAAIMRSWPEIQLVLFIDGDCELVDGFAAAAAALFAAEPGVGVVTGRCREKHPDHTIYNRLCDMEWNGPIGEIRACGGIFMTRAPVFAGAGGFRAGVIAAEDDDFCIRVRENGATIWRIDVDMCLHDAGMTSFSQWWRRAVRAGNAYAQLGELHAGYFAAERRRAWAWGLALPAVALGGAPFTSGLSLALLLLYPLSFIRTAIRLNAGGASMKHATIYAAFLTISKFPNLIGILNYRRNRAQDRPIGIVEYK